MQISVYRYNPDVDNEPYIQDFDLEIPGGRDLMVLDVLALLKERDPSVTYRRSCREGVCGSDGVSMNGKNGLACVTPLSEVARGGKLTIKPLPGLPVIRDLVVDMDQFYKQYEKIKPYLMNAELAPGQGATAVSGREAKSLTAFMSAFFVPAAHLHVLRSGGTPTNLLALQDCFRLIGFLLIVGIRGLKNVSQG